MVSQSRGAKRTATNKRVHLGFYREISFFSSSFSSLELLFIPSSLTVSVCPLFPLLFRILLIGRHYPGQRRGDRQYTAIA